MRGVYVASFFGGNFNISGNYIGGDSPLATVTTQKWTTTLTEAFKFVGIDLASIATASPSSVQGNVVRNFFWSAVQLSECGTDRDRFPVVPTSER